MGIFTRKENSTRDEAILRSLELSNELKKLDTEWPAIQRAYAKQDALTEPLAAALTAARESQSATIGEKYEKLQTAKWLRDVVKHIPGRRRDAICAELEQLTLGIRSEFIAEITAELGRLNGRIRVELQGTKMDFVRETYVCNIRTNLGNISLARDFLKTALTEVHEWVFWDITRIRERIAELHLQFSAIDLQALETQTVDKAFAYQLLSLGNTEPPSWLEGLTADKAS